MKLTFQAFALCHSLWQQSIWDPSRPQDIYPLWRWYYLIIPPLPVCAQLLTWTLCADPKSASLTWVRCSLRSTLSPAGTKQTFKLTGIERDFSYMSASLRATRTRITQICKCHCEKQQSCILCSSVFNFCTFRSRFHSFHNVKWLILKLCGRHMHFKTFS